ncbi:hypothetical protein IT41_12555 [Paracoccus halophilus]|uniref:Uncharacterized protein n=1 Tax=Paracoccus halophilus TaxID=376733 RepID=A0A099EZQ9_9RHOB|nr:hypothetical protein IT41_12555 [Paracoccus halophilus]
MAKLYTEKTAITAAELLRLFGHPWAAAIGQAQPRLLLDMGRTTRSMPCRRLAGQLRKACKPRG